MATLDDALHELELQITVVGGASEFFLEALPLRDGRMELHELQGWKPSLGFRAFPTDPWAGDGAEGAELVSLLPSTDGLVLTDALGQGQHYSSTAMERLSRALKPALIRMPAVIFGCHALEEEWTTLTGVTPVRVAEPSAENALPLVKMLCAVLLRSRLRSIPPPPPPPA
jgi:hypothetical protein